MGTGGFWFLLCTVNSALAGMDDPMGRGIPLIEKALIWVGLPYFFFLFLACFVRSKPGYFVLFACAQCVLAAEAAYYLPKAIGDGADWAGSYFFLFVIFVLLPWLGWWLLYKCLPPKMAIPPKLA